MQWFDAEQTPPPKSGTYLVFRQGNRHPTTRQYYAKFGWLSRDTVLFWSYCPPPPPGHSYPECVEWIAVGDAKTAP